MANGEAQMADAETKPMHAVRILTPGDIDALIALRAEALTDSPWAFTGSPGEARDVELVRSSVSAPGNVVVGGFDEAGALIASAGIVQDQRVKRAHVALIWGVYVTSRRRGTGIGRAVVTRAVEAARAMPGVTTIQLACSENSAAARSLYQSLGFKVWGHEPDAIRIGGTSYAEFHMSMANP